MQQQQTKQPAKTFKIEDLPKRPQRSAQLRNFVRPIDLVSNHFKVQFVNPKEPINVYSLTIDPEVPLDARDKKRKIIGAARKQLEEQGLKPFYVQGDNIWSPVALEKFITAEATLIEEKQKFTIKVSLTKQTSSDQILASKDTKDIMPVVQAYNVRIKQVLRELDYFDIGSNGKYYNRQTWNDNKIHQTDLKVWRGYKNTLCLFQGTPYLLIDFSTRVLRETSALDVLDDCFKEFKNQKDVLENMVGMSIIASYGNHRTYRIEDIKFDMTPESKFFYDKIGQQISYIEYYKKLYNIQIKDRKQPLILHKDKRNPDKKLYLIPELMLMTGMTDQQRSDFRLMKDVAVYTKLSAQQRNNEVLKLQGQLKQRLQKMNMILDSDQKVQGHLINPPKIKLGNKEMANDTGFFILKDAVLKPGHIKDWFLVYASRGKQDDADADFFVDELKKSASKLGIKLDKPYFITINGTNPKDWIRKIDDEIKKGGAPQMLVTFIPEKFKAQLYPALKDYCLAEKGISHQNVLLKFLRNKNPGSVASKIIQQMNVKIGMPIWSIPRPPQVSDRTMLIGIDIYHKLITKQKKSCMGVVASLDSEFTQYFSQVIIMERGDLLTKELTNVIVKAVKAYFDYNGKKNMPETIVIYRDGVGQSQIEALVNVEIAQIEEALSKISPDYKPRVAFVMINKKINHRFFASGDYDKRGGKGQDQIVNPPSGTIVADKIVTEMFDFFLCAQYVTEGTCTPTRFVVLHNTTTWNEETFWMLTYYQCFNYMNWSGAVRVPACVQYAHKLAFLVGDTFQDQLHPSLQRQLCFL